MQTLSFGSSEDKPEVAILIKSFGLNKQKLKKYYIDAIDMTPELFAAWELEYDTPKKVMAVTAKRHILDLLPEIECKGIKILLIADGAYFKFLTGMKKTTGYYGEITPCNQKGYEYMQCLLIPNFQALVHNPMIQGKMDRSLETLRLILTGNEALVKKEVITYAFYPRTKEELLKAFETLHQYDELTCDIEALSLEFWNSGLSTIAFAWNKHEGIGFTIDRHAWNEFGLNNPYRTFIRSNLKQFFKTYKGTMIYQNASYDMKVLTYELWMKEV